MASALLLCVWGRGCLARLVHLPVGIGSGGRPGRGSRRTWLRGAGGPRGCGPRLRLPSFCSRGRAGRSFASWRRGAGVLGAGGGMSGCARRGILVGSFVLALRALWGRRLGCASLFGPRGALTRVAGPGPGIGGYGPRGGRGAHLGGGIGNGGAAPRGAFVVRTSRGRDPGQRVRPPGGGVSTWARELRAGCGRVFGCLFVWGCGRAGGCLLVRPCGRATISRRCCFGRSCARRCRGPWGFPVLFLWLGGVDQDLRFWHESFTGSLQRCGCDFVCFSAISAPPWG